MAKVEPIRRHKLYEQIAERLEAQIHSGRYAPGDQLPAERELVETFGVGRTAVREALFALHKMGLITIASGERARVRVPTAENLVAELSGAARHFLAQPDGIRHFQQARVMFEIALVRHAADHASDEDVDELAAALAANKRARGNFSEFARTDVAFHHVLAMIPRNPIFEAFHSAIAEWLTEQRTTSLWARGAERVAFAAHVKIYEAIAGHDIAAAETAMREHLDDVERLYWSARGKAGRPRPAPAITTARR